MKPFLNGIFGQNLIPEPEASTQSVYAALNAVVEAVLTNKSTNVAQMLQQANAQAQTAIQQGS
jgi:multiple sugar transport system substrate-binding protein